MQRPQGRNVPRRHFQFLKRRSRFLPQKYFFHALDADMARARSVARSTFSVPRRTAFEEEVYIPSYHSRATSVYGYDTAPSYPTRASSVYGYDTTGNEDYTRSQVNRNLVLSSAAMEDNFDISNRSRQRDRDVLNAANKALSPSVSTASGLDKLARGVSEVRKSRSLRRSNPRSSSVPPRRPTPVTTTSIIPLDLTASTPPRSSPYLNYANSLSTTSSLRDNSYRPMYSQLLRTQRSPTREFSPFSRDSSPYRDVSPYRSESPFATPNSGEQTPVEHWYPPGSKGLSRKRQRPRVLSTKRKVGNYYNRLLNRRSTDQSGQTGKYWPYLDVEDIENASVGDLFSDTESLGDTSTTYLVSGDSAGITGGYYSDYPESDGAIVTYSTDIDSDIPSEYVPFRPRARYRSPERDDSDYSIIPYLPTRDPTKNSSSDDIAFNALVAASAARARQALSRVNWDEYDGASMVLSVEGEYKPPEGDTAVGFRYVSRPLTLKVPARQIVSAYDTDDSFTKYMTDLQAFREGIRRRLEEGYKTLSETTRSYTPALTSSSYQSYTPSYTPYTPYTSRPRRELTSYRTRLGDSTDYGSSLELYPVTAERDDSRESMRRSRSLQRTPAEPYPESRALKLYDSNTEPDSRLSTLAKVQIKAATELYANPRATVAARRAMRGQSTPPGPIQTSANISRSEAALIGSKVDVTTPRRRRPQSVYAQNKIRQIRLQSCSRDASPVGAPTAPADTAGLKAHKPVYVQTQARPMQAVDGPKKPNIMSWQPNDEIKPSERAKRRRLTLLKKHSLVY